MLHTIRGGKSPQTSEVKDGQIVPIPADDLTDALADTERMASILSTLLEERIVDNGPRRSFTLSRNDADDIRFASEQLLAMLARAGDVWRAIP